jgi:flagellar assembly factor FliW
MEDCTNLFDLPIDNLLQCIQYLEIQDVMKLSCTCKALLQTCNAKSIWYDLNKKYNAVGEGDWKKTDLNVLIKAIKIEARISEQYSGHFVLEPITVNNLNSQIRSYCSTNLNNPIPKYDIGILSFEQITGVPSRFKALCLTFISTFTKSSMVVSIPFTLRKEDEKALSNLINLKIQLSSENLVRYFCGNPKGSTMTIHVSKSGKMYIDIYKKY